MRLIVSRLRLAARSLAEIRARVGDDLFSDYVRAHTNAPFHALAPDHRENIEWLIRSLCGRVDEAPEVDVQPMLRLVPSN